MRIDLSVEQINGIILSLGFTVNDLRKELKDSGYEGTVKDVVEESLSVKTATMLYLKQVIDNYNLRK
jgi:hypothetical protein